MPAGDDLDEEEGEARAPGAFDPQKRLVDLDQEGIWAEAIYPSLGTWTFNIRTPEIVREGCRISNDFFIEFQQESPRYVVAASIPLLDVDDTVAEIERASKLGFKLGFFPVRPPTAKDPVAVRGVGAGLGCPRSERHGARLPHRHRARRPHRTHRHLLPRSAAVRSSTTSRRPTAASAP